MRSKQKLRRRYELVPIEGEQARSITHPAKPFTFGIMDMLNLDRGPIFRARSRKALADTLTNLNAKKDAVPA